MLAKELRRWCPLPWKILLSIVSKAFKYNRTPLKLRILAIALFLQGMGVRRISR